MKTMTPKKYFSEVTLLVLLGFVLLYPRLQQLDQYVFIDETYYLKDSAKFYWAINHREYNKTDLVVHPGVTTHWLGAMAFWRIFPEYAELQSESNIPDFTFRKLLEENGLSLTLMLVWARAAVASFNVGLLVLAYLLARRLFDPWLAGLGILMAGFDPFYFDFSRFLHVDGMLTTLMFVSLLAFLVYLKEHRWMWLLLSGFVAGLSVLTKVPGILLLGVVGLFGLVDWTRSERSAFGEKRSMRGLASLTGKISIWLGVLLLTVFLLWPAMWADPLGRLEHISAFVLDQGSAEVISPMYFNGEQIPTGVFGWEYAYYYPLSFIWRASPVTLAGLGLLGAAYFLKKRMTSEGVAWDAVGKLLIFVVVYFVLMTVSVKKFDRYLLPVFLPLNLLAGAGFYIWIRSGLNVLTFKKNSIHLRRGLFVLSALVTVGLQAWLVYRVFPYGLSYYNPLLGGGEQAAEVMMVGYGEGLDQAAEYIMTLPDQRDLDIYSFYSGVFWFDYYRQVRELPWYPKGFTEEVFEADYWIIYKSQRQRNLSAPALEFLEGYEPEHTVVINGIEYAWIYNLAETRGE